MNSKTILGLCVLLTCRSGYTSDEKLSPASDSDRVGFPENYTNTFQVLRVVNKPDDQKVVTVYGNREAASVTQPSQLPYPYGSVIVMETATAEKDATGKLAVDAQGNLRKGKITGLHVMRRGKDFGKAYAVNRAGEWEFVEYRPDRSYLTSPQKSGTCAQCHVKAGADRDFVYRGKLAERSGQ